MAVQIVMYSFVCVFFLLQPEVKKTFLQFYFIVKLILAHGSCKSKNTMLPQYKAQWFSVGATRAGAGRWGKNYISIYVMFTIIRSIRYNQVNKDIFVSLISFHFNTEEHKCINRRIWMSYGFKDPKWQHWKRPVITLIWNAYYKLKYFESWDK